MSGLGAYALNRLAMAGLVILVALSVNFVIPRLMPGDPVEQQLAAFVRIAAHGQLHARLVRDDVVLGPG